MLSPVADARVQGSERVDFDLGVGALELKVVAEVNFKGVVWHARRVDEEAVEGVKLGAVTLGAVDSRRGLLIEGGLDEGLHCSGVGEGEGGEGS